MNVVDMESDMPDSSEKFAKAKSRKLWGCSEVSSSRSGAHEKQCLGLVP